MISDADAARHSDGVRRYYDENSRLFERLGQGQTRIHRAVWGPGVETREAAFRYVDELILARLRALGDRPRVVDLGCGVGASLVHLAGRTELTGEGITISPRQAARAGELIAAAGLGGKVRCRQGDFLALPADLAGSDLAFSIEAFVHSPDAARYFGEAGRVLRPGGRLIVCDDFLAAREEAPSPARARALAEFRRGWHVGLLVTVGEAAALASAAGLALVEDVDLSAQLELRRPRDRWIRLLVTLGRPLRPRGAYWHNLLGGNALQWAIGDGLVQYRFLVFERK